MKCEFRMGKISAAAFAEMCGGELWCDRGADLLIGGICTDSRECDRQSVFCALRGERVNGHDYIPQAIANGCQCILCERSCDAIEEAGVVAVVVKDTEMALARFANACRHALSCHTVAVTGSVGKTTAKELIAEVLSTGHKTYRTPGNHNSLIGMPLSVTEIPTDTEWAVLEMGMSSFGEIERLSVTAEPDFAVITNIGTAHIEQLGTRENICRAKLEVLCGLQTGGVLLLNGDEPLLRSIGGKSYKTVYVSTKRENVDFYAKNIRVEDRKTLFDIVWSGGEAKDLCLRVMGRHNVYAALFAFAIGIMSGLNEGQIREGLLRYEPTGYRQNLTEWQGRTLLEDCYNASPESMNAALEVLSDYCQRTGRRSVAVLGDMLELGSQSGALHRRVGAHLSYLGIDRLVAIGKGGYQIAIGARQMGMEPEHILRGLEAERPDDIAEALCSLSEPGDVVLFKASRGIGLERVIAAWKEKTKEKGES